MTAFREVHRCHSSCQHSGPLYVRWPWKQKGAIIEDWPDNPATHMPPGIAVSMGATVRLMEKVDG